MPRIAYLSYSTAEFDGRTHRMARTALEAGYEVVVYARWRRDLPFDEERDGYRIVRVPCLPDLAIPWRRTAGRRRLTDIMAGAPGVESDGSYDDIAPGVRAALETPNDGLATDTSGTDMIAARRSPVTFVKRLLRPFVRPIRRKMRRLRNSQLPYPVMLFPVRPLGWAIPLEAYAEPADIWHGMWAGSLPALIRLRAKHGGRAIYDSRDVYMRSRSFERMGPFKTPFAWLERHWARKVDAVLTVNDSYADLLARRFGIERPPVVRNTPNRYERPTPLPDLIRGALGLGPETRVVLYQGGLLSDRGIEQGMDAIAEVPSAILAIMGFGSAEAEITALAASPRHRDRVRMLPPVPPDDLLDWTASSDVMLMAIQPTSVNHTYTTPQKLWEAIAAGVPVVASDLPGMATIVRDTRCGVLVEPTDPSDIARGIRAVVDAPDQELDAMRRRAWRAGQERFNWERETDTLLGLYRDLLGQPDVGFPLPASQSTSAT